MDSVFHDKQYHIKNASVTNITGKLCGCLQFIYTLFGVIELFQYHFLRGEQIWWQNVHYKRS